MSTSARTPLGGFEERLLMQLKAHVAAQPAPSSLPATRRVARRRLAYPPRPSSVLIAVATMAALLFVVLNLLPGGQTTLAQAFPILTQPPRQLPARLERVLRTQPLPQSNRPSDRQLAYAFRAPTGIGYVVIDRQEKWICLLLPGLGTGTGHIRCDTTASLLLDRQRPLRLIGKHHGSQDIVELLPKGSTATLISTRSTRTLALHNGILTIVTRHPVSITTTIDGYTTTTTYNSREGVDR